MNTPGDPGRLPGEIAIGRDEVANKILACLATWSSKVCQGDTIEAHAKGKMKKRMANFLEALQHERVVVVIRGALSATLGQELSALYEGGLRLFEITVEAPGAIDALSSVREHLPQDALLGASTVLDAGTASLVIAAGAQFVVSPVLLKDVCQVARAHGVPCVPGGMTPTEIHVAYQYGCEVVKVFPAATLGAEFLRELRGPLGFIPLYPTGGITLENAGAFLDAGATAVGLGSALVKKAWVERGDWNALRQEASAWTAFRRSG